MIEMSGRGQQREQVTNEAVNTSLWALAFSNAQPREHCAVCFSLDHTTRQCDDYDKPSTSGKDDEHYSPLEEVPICLKWNWNFCQSTSCKYKHNICVQA